MVELKKEEVIIERVIDGDTFDLIDGRTIRLLNINSPEKSTPHSNLSTSFLKSFENKTVLLSIDEKDKYDRFLGRLYSMEGVYINLELIKKGLASKFLVADYEKSLFSKEEEKAIINSRGIWQKSDYFGCFRITVKYEEELVLIKNSCPAINFYKFYVKDESRKMLILPKTTSKEIYIHTFNGLDNDTDIFWNSQADIWNDDADTLYLFDKENKIAGFYYYGY